VVAALSFVLLPLALLSGLLGATLGIIALRRTGPRDARTIGQSTAGVICSVLALAIAITLSVRIGTWAVRNVSVFTHFDKCIAQAGNRSEVSNCIARFALDVRP